MRNFITPITLGLASILAFLMCFKATAFAANTAVPPDADPVAMLQPIWEAFSRGDYLYAGCIVIVLLVAVCKRYGFVKSKKGMIGLAFAGSFAATLAAHLIEGAFAVGMLWDAFKIGAGAAGGYAVIKELLVEPYLMPLQAKLPKWTQPLLAMVLWIFDKKASGQTDGEKAIAAAEKAGDAAVIASPAQGTAAILGQPLEIK